MTEEIKEEVKKEVKEEVKGKVAKKVSPFIKSTDILEGKVEYYLKDDGTGFMVEGAQEGYDPKKTTDCFTFTFRIPNQKDSNLIAMRESNSGSTENEMGILKAFTALEYVRFLVLLDGWSFDEPCTEDSVEELHPSFTKGMVSAVREKIGNDGII